MARNNKSDNPRNNEEKGMENADQPKPEEKRKLTLPLSQVPIDLRPGKKQNSINPARIKVVGIGGAGGNAVHRMMQAGLTGVQFIIINTDAQALDQHPATDKIQIGQKVTRGLGCGGDPEVGFKAASESKAEIGEALEGADMVFITAGMGGGTGTGGAPVIAELAKERDALTVGVVTRPFTFEGGRRAQIAEAGIASLKEKLDTLITIPNDKLTDVVSPETTLMESFEIADDILRQGVQGVSDLITIPGLINLDFADVKAIMWEAGTALIGIGQQAGENRAVEAARQAITSPLLETTIDGANGVLINITGGPSLTLAEVKAAADEIYNVSDQDANIIFGAVIDERMKDYVRVTVLATGFDDLRPEPKIPMRERMKEPGFQSGDKVDEEELDIPAFLRRGSYSG
ncbi:MAG: cell division protein FtsZ [bacterium]|nr:cell division protein FtsZ [bacterium]